MKRLALAFALAVSAALPATATAAVFHFATELNGLNENPDVLTPGMGSVDLFWNDTDHTMRIVGSFSGLIGVTSDAHIHGPVALPTLNGPVISPSGPRYAIPLGVRSGAFDLTLLTNVATTYRPAFITASGGTVAQAESAFFTHLSNEQLYFNIHTSAASGGFPGGEIRGTLVAVPEAGTWALMIAGFGATGAMLRRRRLHVLA